MRLVPGSTANETSPSVHLLLFLEFYEPEHVVPGSIGKAVLWVVEISFVGAENVLIPQPRSDQQHVQDRICVGYKIGSLQFSTYELSLSD